MKKLAVAVIGAGRLGSLHAKMIADIPAARLVAVVDKDATRSAAVAGQYGARACGSIGEILRDVEAVTIATPTMTHHDVALAALSAGKHVFLEKPITSTTEEAMAIVKASRDRSLKVQVGHIERFNPAILALEKYRLAPMFIESHRLAQFNPRGTDVAVVLDLMIHDIDLIMSLVRSPVERIEANGVAVVSQSLDIANARLQFENGCVANVTASRISQKKMRKMRLFQKDAYISVDFSEGIAEVFRLVDEGDASAASTLMLGEINSGSVKRNIVYEQPEIRQTNALRHELELFVNAVLDGTEPIVSAEDGLRALQVAQDIIHKIEHQKFSR